MIYLKIIFITYFLNLTSRYSVCTTLRELKKYIRFMLCLFPANLTHSIRPDDKSMVAEGRH